MSLPRIPHRFKILYRWFQDQGTAVETRPDFLDTLRVVCDLPNRMGGKRFAESMAEEGDLLRINLKGHAHPLYWPKAMDLTGLYVVLNESFDPRHWHRYEYAGTFLRPTDVVVDAGTAEGIFALLNASRVKKIYAFEPLPTFAKALSRTLAHLDNVEVTPALLGDKPGETHLTFGGFSSHKSETGDAVVKIETLDHFFFERGIEVNYLKADIEGSEVDFLEGGRQLIAKHLPRIAITTYHIREHAQQIGDLLRSINPDYQLKTKGLHETGAPVVMHAWVTPKS